MKAIYCHWCKKLLFSMHESRITNVKATCDNSSLCGWVSVNNTSHQYWVIGSSSIYIVTSQPSLDMPLSTSRNNKRLRLFPYIFPNLYNMQKVVVFDLAMWKEIDSRLTFRNLQILMYVQLVLHQLPIYTTQCCMIDLNVNSNK